MRFTIFSDQRMKISVKDKRCNDVILKAKVDKSKDAKTRKKALCEDV